MTSHSLISSPWPLNSSREAPRASEFLQQVDSGDKQVWLPEFSRSHRFILVFKPDSHRPNAFKPFTSLSSCMKNRHPNNILFTCLSIIQSDNNYRLRVNSDWLLIRWVLILTDAYFSNLLFYFVKDSQLCPNEFLLSVEFNLDYLIWLCNLSLSKNGSYKSQTCFFVIVWCVAIVISHLLYKNMQIIIHTVSYPGAKMHILIKVVLNIPSWNDISADHILYLGLVVLACCCSFPPLD